MLAGHPPSGALNFGFVIGAVLQPSRSGQFPPNWRQPRRSNDGATRADSHLSRRSPHRARVHLLFLWHAAQPDGDLGVAATLVEPAVAVLLAARSSGASFASSVAWRSVPVLRIGLPLASTPAGPNLSPANPAFAETITSTRRSMTLPRREAEGPVALPVPCKNPLHHCCAGQIQETSGHAAEGTNPASVASHRGGGCSDDIIEVGKRGLRGRRCRRHPGKRRAALPAGRRGSPKALRSSRVGKSPTGVASSAGPLVVEHRREEDAGPPRWGGEVFGGGQVAASRAGWRPSR